jgi:hypothetical protein
MASPVRDDLPECRWVNDAAFCVPEIIICLPSLNHSTPREPHRIVWSDVRPERTVTDCRISSVIGPTRFRPNGTTGGSCFSTLSGVFLRVARLQERNGDVGTDWSVFQGNFGLGASRSWLLGRLRRSAFRRHIPKADFGARIPQSSTVVAHHERDQFSPQPPLRSVAHTTSEVARTFNVHPATIYRIRDHQTPDLKLAS